MSSEYPSSVQVYLPLTRSARRSSVCPEHHKRTSQWRGIQESLEGVYYWVFRCPSRNGHLFLALPDPTAPVAGTREAEAEWVRQQAAAKPQH